MLVNIIRHKGGKTHFALLVDANGHVSAWGTMEPTQGFTPEVAEKVARFYSGRENAGEIAFENAETGEPTREAVNGPVLAAGIIGARPTDLVIDAINERDEFRRQAVTLGDEVERLREEIEGVADERDRARAALDTAKASAAAFDKQFEDMDKYAAVRDEAIKNAYRDVCGAMAWGYDPNTDATNELPRALSELLKDYADLKTLLADAK